MGLPTDAIVQTVFRDHIGTTYGQEITDHKYDRGAQPKLLRPPGVFAGLHEA